MTEIQYDSLHRDSKFRHNPEGRGPYLLILPIHEFYYWHFAIHLYSSSILCYLWLARVMLMRFDRMQRLFSPRFDRHRVQ